MSGLKFNIDVAGLAAQFKELAVEAEQSFMEGVKGLAAMTHAHVAEQASEKLHTSAKIFKENLGFEEIAPGVWAVSIAEPALWIEEGISKDHDMKPDLLKGSPGYKVIPFDPSKNPKAGDDGKFQSRPQDNQNTIAAQLKSGLAAINKKGRQDFKAAGQPGKYQNIGINKIEKDANGSPRVGKLHEFDMPSIYPSAKAKHPALKGVTIYQSKDEKTGNIRRDVLTFRTVSTKSDPASWKHPGFEGKHFLDEAEEWAKNEWESKILPEILKSLGGK